MQAFAAEIDDFSEIDAKVQLFPHIPGQFGLKWKEKLHFRRLFQIS
jgi:hypothetical protein